jgi:cytochrome c oxidase cbb3-type subunit 3
VTTPNFQFPTSKPSGSKQLSERPPGCYNAATFARLLRGIRLGVGSWALVIVAFAAVLPAAQDPVPPAAGQEQQGGRGRGRGGGPNFPQQQRQLADAAVLARGKGLYESTCSACHGIDLRGGQQGGPNLLRSQVLLSDKAGEAITPIVRGGRPNPPGGVPPMPPFALPDDDIKAIAEYLHSVLARAGRQGRPPEGEAVPPEKVLVGDPAAGQTYFAAKCSSCHSPGGDLKGVVARAADPRELQDLWVSGGGGRGRGGRGGEGGSQRPASVTVTPVTGQRVEGRLVRMDDFIVVLVTNDGVRRTFVRQGDEPKVEVRDPSNAHRELVQTLTDKDMHNVTAYLWSLR